MQDYVQLITKLLADKEELTGALEQLEEQLADSHQHCEALARAQTDRDTCGGDGPITGTAYR